MEEEIKYPKGTTKEQWDLYNEQKAAHDKFIECYRFFLDRIVNHLEWKGKRMGKASWTPDEIKDWITSEIVKSNSMDAPNKPGYYRANND